MISFCRQQAMSGELCISNCFEGFHGESSMLKCEARGPCTFKYSGSAQNVWLCFFFNSYKRELYLQIIKELIVINCLSKFAFQVK